MELVTSITRSQEATPGDDVSESNELVVVHGDNILALHSAAAFGVIDSQAHPGAHVTLGVEIEQVTEESTTCLNGVCSIAWKPKRPSAA